MAKGKIMSVLFKRGMFLKYLSCCCRWYIIDCFVCVRFALVTFMYVIELYYYVNTSLFKKYYYVSNVNTYDHCLGESKRFLATLYHVTLLLRK